MATITLTDQQQAAVPLSLRSRLKVAGPGIFVAATAVGAGDLVAGLVVGGRFGLALLWAVVLGAVLKFALNEAIGRWHLATGTSLLAGWHAMGRWATGYFAVYVLVFGIVFGAAVTSTAALPLNALFPAVPVWAFAVLNAVAGGAVIWVGGYALLERLMKILVGVMFVIIVGFAVLVLPDLSPADAAAGLVPRVPAGSLLYLLGLIGGVGGTIILVAYGYWLQAKGWRGGGWVPVMRIDIAVAYALTATFVVALVLVGTALLAGTPDGLEVPEGLIGFSEQLQSRFGAAARLAFLVGFWATAFTSILGAWSGVSYLFADLVHVVGGKPDDSDTLRSSRAYRGYLLWITFPPMLLLLLGRPISLVLAYTAIGALFMPFLAGTLLWLMNQRSMPLRNGWLANGALVACMGLFVVLAVQELSQAF